MCEDCEADPWYADIQAFLKKYPEAEWGPAHSVFSDFNTDNPCVESCLNDANQIKWFIEHRMQTVEEPLDNSQQLYTLHFQFKDMMEELDATIAFLQQMLKEDRFTESPLPPETH